MDFKKNIWLKCLRFFNSKKIAYQCSEQNLDMYWTKKMANILESWGEDSVWREIQLILSNCDGKVLDIACGTGKVMGMLRVLPGIEVYGFDISDFLIQKAINRGIPAGRLLVGDASSMPYSDNSFNYSYSIGSLEHFTEKGINSFISECYRVTKNCSFHMIPVSKSTKDEGWLTTIQSFYNNSVQWWSKKFREHYDNVLVLPSTWDDKISEGKWIICKKSVYEKNS